MRVFKDRYYLMGNHPGISGFVQFDTMEYWVATGHYAMNHKTEVQGEFIPQRDGIYRIGDGHLPEHQPQLPLSEAIQWLDQNPFQRITAV